MNLCDQLQEYGRPRGINTARQPVFKTEPVVKSQESQ